MLWIAMGGYKCCGWLTMTMDSYGRLWIAMDGYGWQFVAMDGNLYLWRLWNMDGHL